VTAPTNSPTDSPTTGLSTLALADDALIASQRLAEWVSRAPTLEEDVALANIALDQLGAARLLLAVHGAQTGQNEDQLAYLRDDHEFRNGLLVELPFGQSRGDLDFGWTLSWLLFLSAAQRLRYEDLAAGLTGARSFGETAPTQTSVGAVSPKLREESGVELAAVAAKTVKESAYHCDHAEQWVLRLGDGTEESHRRIQQAVDGLWPYTHELTDGIRERWLELVEPVLAKATLTRPDDGWKPDGGRVGRHTEHLSYLLTEMQALHRAHPGVRW
jgi:ring-1,2-phenylacetyl-CoA epoxidase subunit PaaC